MYVLGDLRGDFVIGNKELLVLYGWLCYCSNFIFNFLIISVIVIGLGWCIDVSYSIVE